VSNKLRAIKTLCQDDLLFFTKYFHKELHGDKFITADFHEEICRVLQALTKGQLEKDGRRVNNLIINIPPRYGKTEIAVKKFIAWCLAINAQAKFIHLSYSSELALDNSSGIKEIILSDEYQSFWPMRLKDDAKSKQKWYTQEGGGVYATQAGGSITGFGAGNTVSTDAFDGAIIIDDPLKVDDALSEIERAKVNQRMNTTIKSRRNHRDTPIIVIMQRLHEEDMTGFLLDTGIGEDFYHLCLPAIRGNKPLWEYKHSLEELDAQKAADPYTFSGQMMQAPSPEEGIFFTQDMFEYYDEVPKYYRAYGASDYAVSVGKGDYTVHGIFLVDADGDIFVADMWRGQTTPDVWIDQFLDMYEKWDTSQWGEESGQILKSVDPFIAKRCSERELYPFRKQYVSSSDKPTRAQAIRGRASQRKIYLPKNTPWVADFLKECLMFPNGSNDDMVDVLSLFGRMLAEIRDGDLPDIPEDRPDRYAPTIEEINLISRNKDGFERI
jgi:predicted phage terminase large subunit-like protein